MVSGINSIEWGFLFLIFAYLSWHFIFSENAHRRRAIRGTTTRITDVKEGVLVKVAGRVSAVGEPLMAPVSQRPCCAYRVLVRVEGEENGKTVLDESGSMDLYLEDESGCAFLPLSREPTLKLIIVHDRTVQAQTSDEVDPATASFLSDRGIDFKDLAVRQERLTVIEGLLENGSSLTVVGRGHRESVSRQLDQGDRTPPPCLVLRAPPTLLLTNNQFQALWGRSGLT